jgi:hypothetical protein
MTEEEFYGRPVPPKAEPKEPSEAYMDDALRTLSNQYHGELTKPLLL